MTGTIDAYEKLIKAGIGFESADQNGHTSVFFAVARTAMPVSLDIATWLLEHEANKISFSTKPLSILKWPFWVRYQTINGVTAHCEGSKYGLPNK